jgi:predicted CoA-substrate-specific enzyme activase
MTSTLRPPAAGPAGGASHVLAARLQDLIAPGLEGELLLEEGVVGLDIGSRAGKAVLIKGDRIYAVTTATAVRMQETAERLLVKLKRAAGEDAVAPRFIVGTGYGRVALSFAQAPTRIVTEISCHAMGAHYLHAATRTIVDIGGQDSKAIKVDPGTGQVVEFIMNDKCAAGTGRFLEKVAHLLGLSTQELGAEALLAGSELPVSSQCVVFAESEVISLKARGESRADIAAGIHTATARRVRNLVNRLGLEPDLVFSGGVSNNQGMRLALERAIGHPFSPTRLDMVYGGALGAAIYAQKYLRGLTA